MKGKGDGKGESRVLTKVWNYPWINNDGYSVLEGCPKLQADIRVVQIQLGNQN